ncbi:MAG: hypothetical protein ACNA70_01155 [Brevefilum sp.]
MTQLFNADLIAQTKAASSAHIIQPVQIGQTDSQNELVFFVKPELLSIDDEEKILNSLNLIEDKFTQYHVKVNGLVIVPGQVLAAHQIMNRHYGFINQLSRKASEIVTDETREEMFKLLGMEPDNEHIILGGHEFQQLYQIDVETLNNIWFGQGANKLRSGFYFIRHTHNGDPVLLVNGFHPSQLMHYTRPDHRILLMLIHTDTDWHDLKFDLVGDTFPERAKSDSIRGQLFANPARYGQKEVTINTNGVHLSAGPFEAAFEVVNFFGDILSHDAHAQPPLTIQRAIDDGIDSSVAMSFLDNPALGESDLFSATENLNTYTALQFAREALLQ